MSQTLNVVRKQIFSIRGFIIRYIQDLLARIENFTGIIKVGQSGGITMKSPRVEKQQG